MKHMKKFLLSILFGLSVAGCTSESEVVSANLSKSADSFEVYREIIFYNSWVGEYMLKIEGLCSIKPLSGVEKIDRIAVICKTGENQYKKHFLGLSGQVTYFAEQVDPSDVDPYYYRVIIKPTTLIPELELQ